MHFGLMRELSVGQKFSGVVISPNAKRVISPADRELMDQYGVAVVECSWVRIKDVPWKKIGGQCERLRTYLVQGRGVVGQPVFADGFCSTIPRRRERDKLRTPLATELR